ncbi:MAG: type II toxin-antitoxin system prevent-host-death family antitoxin [Sedimenticola sp.]
MNTITANDLKTKGVSILEISLTEDPEVMISVRGKERFVVMKMEHYNYLREMELEAALLEVQQDYADEKYVKESAGEHIEQIVKA